MADPMPVIGIDLGTTCCCVGVWRNGRVEIVPNDQDKRTTPSCVAFTDEERLIGEGANNQVSRNQSNTVFDVKRLMGRSFSDASVQSDAMYWPFGVTEGPDDKPLIRVSYLGEEKAFWPEEISAMVLVKMKETAEAQVGVPITDAVITVPAYFNGSQRQATKDAGVIAGLNVLGIINEPTAAAISYNFNKNWSHSNESPVLVYDLGGGTLDVSLVVIKNGALKVRATAGDTHLGGEDFTNNMVDHFVSVFKKQNQKDISGDKKAVARLRRSCEEAKKGLSTNPRILVEVEALFEGIDFRSALTRDQFEQLNEELFRRCMEPVERCLVDAKMDKTKVEDVVLVGGSTRIPRVQKLVQDFFNGKELCRNINADEAVAYGATFQAAMLLTMGPNLPPLYDITPFSQGIVMLEGGLMCTVVARNSPIPGDEKMEFTTTQDQQSSMHITVCEGETGMAKRKFHFSGIALAPKGVPKIKVRFHMDPHGLLHVSAEDEEGKTITTSDVGRFSMEEIHTMVQGAHKYKAQDEEYKKNVQARNDIENLLYTVSNNMKELEDSAARLLLHPEPEATPEEEEEETSSSSHTDLEMIQARDVNETTDELQDHIKILQETAERATEWLQNKDLATIEIIELKKQIEDVYHSINGKIESAKKMPNESFPQEIVQ